MIPDNVQNILSSDLTMLQLHAEAGKPFVNEGKPKRSEGIKYSHAFCMC